MTLRRVAALILVVLALGACGVDPNAAATTSPATTSTPTTAPPSSASVSPKPASAGSSSSLSTTSSASASGNVVTLAGDGVTYATSAQVTASTWMTTEEKTYFVGELARLQKSEGGCSTIVVTAYRESDLVNGQVFGCGGGYAVLWGKGTSGWTMVGSGQDVPECAVIRKAKIASIPKDFFGGQCYSGGKVVTYTP